MFKNPNPYINAAWQGNNKLGIYVAVFLLVIIANVLGSIPGGWALIEWKSSPDSLPIYAVLAMMLLGFVTSVIALWLSVQHIHKRNPLTMIRPTAAVDWGRVAKSGGLWVACTAAVEMVTYLSFPEKYTLSLNWAEFLPCVVVGILLIPLQTSFEELFFRGYLMQGIGSWNLWAGVVITSVLFGLAHSFNDEIEAVGSLGIAMIYYIGVGLFLALLTLNDESLELPLGIHATNNLYAFLIVGYPSSSAPSSTIWMLTEFNFSLMMIQWVVAVGLYLLLAPRFLGIKLSRN